MIVNGIPKFVINKLAELASDRFPPRERVAVTRMISQVGVV